ncbi:MAG: hypothetical protein ABIV63_14590 [Caldimonas sp.]
MSTSLLFLGLFFGCVGAGYCVYGRRQHAVVPFLCGLLLIGLPYLIGNATILLLVGALLAAAPFIFSRF